MAITHRVEVVVDSSVSDDEKTHITDAVHRVLRGYLTAIVQAVTYSAGSTSVSQLSIAISGASADYGVSVVMDSAVVGNDDVLHIMAGIINVLRARTKVPTFGATYTVGDRVFNEVITVTK